MTSLSNLLAVKGVCSSTDTERMQGACGCKWDLEWGWRWGDEWNCSVFATRRLEADTSRNRVDPATLFYAIMFLHRSALTPIRFGAEMFRRRVVSASKIHYWLMNLSYCKKIDFFYVIHPFSFLLHWESCYKTDFSVFCCLSTWRCMFFFFQYYEKVTLWYLPNKYLRQNVLTPKRFCAKISPRKNVPVLKRLSSRTTWR